ncbi:MAG: elongation factor Ts [Nitrosospira sp.]|nr:elongation factor Ts [Nitrosospira sp.]MDW7643242.1 translation elongation factor Ts [Nitrosomonadaceae bacterium]MBI0415151.1 elongation factor Ts [Nitrosospira sp.]MBI0415842.1 elongation factor Ts [Nitrosospira sp.]MBI0416735.1 elongation factor Ts [Nitrosospira sp.]
MIDIIASTVKELRDLTGLGMMECKRALVETAGDMKAAEELLRIRSGIKASKASGRIAAEGMIGAHIATDGKSGALVEVNCETDFVSRNEDFGNFAKSLAQLVTTKNITDLEVITKSTLSDGRNTEESRKELVMRLGENISVRRCVRHTTQGRLALYLHGSKIGVIIDYTGGDEALGKDLAMHIAANKPMCVSIEQVPADLLERERLIYTAQAAESGKSADIIEKMVNGRIAKYLAEITLLGQPFVKDPEQTVEKLITKKSAKINGFTMFVVGDGIEKKSDDFAVEVMNQISKAKGIHGN